MQPPCPSPPFLLLLVICLAGCGHVVIHERLLPVGHTDSADGVSVPCAQGHIRVLPVHVNTRRGRQSPEFDHFTFAVEYTDLPGTCTTGDVSLTGREQDKPLAIDEVVKSRRYPDRPGTLTCFYRLRNELDEGRIYDLHLHQPLANCSTGPIQYRYEIQHDFRWPVEK